MSDPQALQVAISARIAQEFGQSRLALIELEEVCRALQSEHEKLKVENDRNLALLAALKASAGVKPPE